MRPPSFWPGSICHLPPIRGGSANQDGVGIGKPAPIPLSICASPDILVNSPPGLVARNFTLKKNVFRSFFSKKKTPLSGAPSVRRLKTYSAQSGYVYQYFYEGQRAFHTGGERGTEFVFNVSADRKTSHPLSVFVPDAALLAWEQAHAHPLSSTERYAVSKMA